MLQIQVQNLTSRFVTPPSADVIASIRFKLRYKIEGAQFVARSRSRYSNRPIEEYKYLYNKKTHSFPSGLLNDVLEILNEYQLTFSILDQRPDYPIHSPLNLNKFILRDYQTDTEAKAFAAKNGVIKIATGGGKTAIFTSMLGKLNGYKNIVFVRRQLLLLQTIKILQEQLGVPIGQIGAGVIDIQNTTVAMIPTVARAVDASFSFQKSDEDDEDDNTIVNENERRLILEYLKECHSLIIDECHCLPAESAQLVSKHATQARYRWGFSATPWRGDGKDILIHAATGPRIVDIDASYLIDRKYLVAPHIFFLKTPPCNIPNKSQGQYQVVYKNLVVQNEARNNLILKHALEAYERSEHVLILVQQIEHGKILLDQLEQQGVWAEYISGSSTIITREETIQRFRSRTRAVLIGSSVLDEGIDIPEITVLINASGGKSSAKYYQKIGRCIRPFEDKKRAIVIDFLDQDIKYLSNHAQARLDILRTERLYKIKIQGSNSNNE